MNISQPIRWQPTTVGKVFTGSKKWVFHLGANEYRIVSELYDYSGTLNDLEALIVDTGYFWATIEIPLQGNHKITLDGIPNQKALELNSNVKFRIKKEAARLKAQVEATIKAFNANIQPILAWANKSNLQIEQHLASKGWLSHELISDVTQSKPTCNIDFDFPAIREHIDTLPNIQSEAIKLWQSSIIRLCNILNEEQFKSALDHSKVFFNTIEKSPLTQEQIRAAVCFDNRNLLVASAGSGKTSTMVAKCGFAIKQGYFKPEEILLLAFNNDAAAELRNRIKVRFEQQKIPYEQVTAKTFHAFGLDVIGTALGRRPSIPAWIESGKDIETLMELVDEIKDRDINFRIHWDLFRLVIGQDLPKFGDEEKNPDSWNFQNQSKGFWTFNNEYVKSRGELLIANWLFYNGINYQYEAPYKHDTADAKYSQYTPDFYFPDIDVYLEHWALDANGEPPVSFANYKESMLWKKELHAKHGTHLLETTMADLWSGKAFTYLSASLSKLGLKFDPNPDRAITGRRPIENERLIKTFRTFLTHVKNNRLTMAELERRLNSGMLGNFRYRHTIFLMLFEAIWQAWDAKLRSTNCIDFDDMLNQATDLIEEERWKNHYQLVMVDEFQDLSQSRTRLLHALLKQPNQYLFAVGDDWQSINRFAGAHLGVMTDFETTFGKSTLLKLESTFRCPQSLCDISTTFIQRNPKQLKKLVRSEVENIRDPLTIIRVQDESQIQSVIQKRLDQLGSTLPEKSGKNSIYILGRYNNDRAYMPFKFDKTKFIVQFITVHSSKGLEADHIIIPKLSSESLGFPSQIEDDPVLQLAMPKGDVYPFSEERRLFYVALTRSRATVTLITLEKKESPFILELVEQLNISVQDVKGEKQLLEVCPKCKTSFITEKLGKFGLFYSCSGYPFCDYKPPKTRR